MPTGKPIIYWDSCVFLAWIKDENRPNDEMDGVYDVAQKIQNDQCVLLTSSITSVEILESTLMDEAKQRLSGLFKRRNCQRAAADDRVMQLAYELRDYYQRQRDVDELS